MGRFRSSSTSRLSEPVSCSASGCAAAVTSRGWLLHLRFAAPRVARWPSYPDVGERRIHRVQRVVVGLLRTHTNRGALRRSAVEIHRTARQLRCAPRESLGRLGGLPWRDRLPDDIRRTCAEVAAAGICVHHWVVSDALVDEAHRLALHVNAWTVNNPFAARMMACAGVDSITTDRVDLVRLALRTQPSPVLAGPGHRQLRGAVRIAPM
jgi:Glycerophosphoryl diester phosphodiesterase family